MNRFYGACRFWPVLLLLLASRASAMTLRGERRPSPPFTGTALPTPPQQKAPWSPPGGATPANLVSAVTALFKEGLADPRGCSYRAIEVGTGSCWSGDAGVVETHGWVLKAAPGETQRFAVCWNGLVYPAVSVGDPADLRADVDAAVKADEELRARRNRENPRFPFYRFRNAVGEGASVSHASLLPLKAALLLCLGEEMLARRVWAAWTAGMRENTNDDRVHLKDPYLMLATDWTWALYDRAVCAHMRGDDRLALLGARALVPIGAAVEAEATRRAFPQRAYEAGERKGQKVPHLAFLDRLPDFLADQERRAREGERARVPLAQLAGITDPKARIAALIAELDQIAARQWGQPGGVRLASDPIVAALIREGSDAVEPLLKCLEEDTRLTRSVHFGRDFGRYRSVLGVHEAAYLALMGILKVSAFSPGSTADDLSAHGMDGRRRVAAALRAYWNRFKDLSLEERWFRTLLDDNAGPRQWLEAAQNIVRPVDVKVSPGSMFGGDGESMPRRKPGEEPRLSGEVLRNKPGPPLSMLMAKRAEAMAQPREGSVDPFALYDACRIALCLARWDLPAAGPTLRAVFHRCADLMAPNANRGRTSADDTAGRYIGDLTIERVRGHDPDAASDYAFWLRRTPPEAVAECAREALAPLWLCADQPAIAVAPAWLFGDPASPWVPLVKLRKGVPTWRLSNLPLSPLVGLPAFRVGLLRGLDDRSPGGVVSWRPDGKMEIRTESGWQARGDDYALDPDRPQPGVEVRFRTCDLYANILSQLDGAPRCEVYWPEAKRDQAVAACAAFLRRYGDRFRYSEEQRALQEPPIDPQARMSFPRLDRPATPDDVEQGRAIFSLAGQGETRVWPMPLRPMPARWVTLKDYPFEQQWSSATGESGTRVAYRQDGLVWQAEEVRRDGKWQRYYGFVGPHTVARVPAEEIESPRPLGSQLAYAAARLRAGGAAHPPRGGAR